MIVIYKKTSISEGVKTGGEIVNTKRIKDTAFLAFLNEQDLKIIKLQ